MGTHSTLRVGECSTITRANNFENLHISNILTTGRTSFLDFSPFFQTVTVEMMSTVQLRRFVEILVGLHANQAKLAAIFPNFVLFVF